jgi:zinc transport system substrate-binding protein
MSPLANARRSVGQGRVRSVAGQRAHSARNRRFGLGLMALLMLAPPVRVGASDAPRLLVAVSINPLADFVRAVGDGLVEVVTLVPPGASPHTYELKPSQVTAVARARLLVLNGAGLEYWASKLVQAVGSGKLAVVDTSKGIPLLDEGAHGANPHVWLDVRQAMIQVRHIRDALVESDASHAPAYEANTAAYLARLDRLDVEIATQVSHWKQRQFIAFHPAWAYFARRYGLEQAAVIERFPGREPSPADVARVVEVAKRIGARAIFAEPQFSTKAADVIARESGARVVLLDPLGATLRQGGYVELMRYDVAQMATALE